MFTTVMGYQVTIYMPFCYFKPYALIKVITNWTVGTSLEVKKLLLIVFSQAGGVTVSRLHANSLRQ